jgi:hypothetical protein
MIEMMEKENAALRKVAVGKSKTTVEAENMIDNYQTKDGN